MTLTLLAVRNALRNKARCLMTLLGIAVTVTTFLTLETALGSWDTAQSLARRDRLVTRHKVPRACSTPSSKIVRFKRSLRTSELGRRGSSE